MFCICQIWLGDIPGISSSSVDFRLSNQEAGANIALVAGTLRATVVHCSGWWELANFSMGARVWRRDEWPQAVPSPPLSVWLKRRRAKKSNIKSGFDCAGCRHLVKLSGCILWWVKQKW
jgi:hypothetical protein